MKLRNLAALIFRLLGASFILTGIAEILGAIMDTGSVYAMVGGVSELVIGFLAIFYSKQLAALFCRGLARSDGLQSSEHEILNLPAWHGGHRRQSALLLNKTKALAWKRKRVGLQLSKRLRHAAPCKLTEH